MEFKALFLGKYPEHWGLMSIDELKAGSKNSIAMGPFGSRIKKENFIDSGVPVIRGNNLKKFEFNEEEFVFLSEEKANELKASQVFRGDIVITHRGTLGQVGYIPSNSKYEKYIVSQSGLKITLNNEVINSKYVYYYLNSNIGQHQLLMNKSQVGVPAIAQASTSIKKIMVPIPPLFEQEKIVRILDLISMKNENNNSIINKLEDILSCLFKQWFIDFEFPNEQGLPYRSTGGEIAESELGKIPKGWQVGSIGDICILKNEKVNLDKSEETFNYIGLEHMPQGSIALNDWESSEKVSGTKAVFNRGDLLFGKLRPYFKKVGIAATNGVCSTDILVMLPKNLYEYSFLISHLTQDKFIEYTTSTATGTRMPRSGWNQISNYAIVIPPVELLENYNEKILPMLQMIQELVHENNSLKSLRNYLLPKLLSGEIEIPEESVVEL